MYIDKASAYRCISITRQKKLRFKKFNKKLAPKYESPFEIVEVKSPTVYILDNTKRESRRLVIIHVSELKRYVRPCNKTLSRLIIAAVLFAVEIVATRLKIWIETRHPFSGGKIHLTGT